MKNKKYRDMIKLFMKWKDLLLIVLSHFFIVDEWTWYIFFIYLESNNGQK